MQKNNTILNTQNYGYTNIVTKKHQTNTKENIDTINHNHTNVDSARLIEKIPYYYFQNLTIKRKNLLNNDGGFL